MLDWLSWLIPAGSAGLSGVQLIMNWLQQRQHSKEPEDFRNSYMDPNQITARANTYFSSMLRQVNGPMIELQGVSKVYGEGQAATHALRGIDLCIQEGEFVAVMGPSGSGKSTCMNILGCLDTPTSGTYLFKGVDVAALTRNQRALLRRHYLGFVFQGYNLLNRTSALENVELPLIYRATPTEERRARARQGLEAVGLTGWESHTPSELSGGQEQRVAIARAIVTEPAVLFADEPTGNLDSVMSREIMALLRALNETRGITVVMVTHEPEMASFAKRTIRFRDGRIESDGRDGGAA